MRGDDFSTSWQLHGLAQTMAKAGLDEEAENPQEKKKIKKIKRSNIKSNLLTVVEMERPMDFKSFSAISFTAPKSNTEIQGVLCIPTLDASFVISSTIISDPTKQELTVMQPRA